MFRFFYPVVKLADALITKGKQIGKSQRELLPDIKSTAQNVLKKNSLLVQEQHTIKLLRVKGL